MSHYVNFFIKSCYSFFESAISIDRLIDFAKENGIRTLTLADTNNMYGAIEFYKKCLKNGIKPIIGTDLDFGKYRLLLFAKNFAGYKYLLELVSHFNNNEKIELNDDKNKNLLIINHPDNSYVPMIADIITKDELYISGATFLDDEQAVLGDVFSFLNNSNKNIHKFQKKYSLFPKVSPEKLTNTLKMADLCDLRIPTLKFELPTFDSPFKILPEKYLGKYCNEVLESKFTSQEIVKYQSRLKYELEVITEMGFANYFLIIHDLIKWAKEHNILIGPGRGSAPSSLVSFLLGITDIDPIKSGLLFERFLNPKRVTFPDIDVDIEDERRQELLDYVFEKYGFENVAHIITFQKSGAKMALRDTLRYLQAPLFDINALTKKISHFHTLEEAYTNDFDFRATINNNAIYRKAFEIAKLLEGLPRQASTHAAGIVISKYPIVKNVPTIKIDGKLHTQYSMEYLEDCGLIKIDLLGLRNLTIIKKIQESIYKEFNRKINLQKIPPTDRKVHQVFTKGETNGIFQFESPGMQRTLQKVEIDSFNDIVAVSALFRPGPIDYIDAYAKNKKNKSITLFHSKILNEVLQSTYGIIVYQEQIMLIAQKFAGLDFAEADTLRSAISKKKIGEMAKIKSSFFENAAKLNRPKQEIIEVFDLIEKFASYGFNKAHATAYSLIAYWMAYMKCYFPIHFFAALLDVNYQSIELFQKYYYEAKSYKLKFTSPSINLSQIAFEVDSNKIIMPFTIIKGISKAMAQKIVLERNAIGKFLDFFECIAILKFAGIAENVLINLVKGNAFGEFGSSIVLFENFSNALRFSELVKTKKDGVEKLDFSIIKMKNFTKEVPINLDRQIRWDKEIYSFGLNFHPSDLYEHTTEIRYLEDVFAKSTITAIVLVEWIKVVITKKNQEMAFIKISDKSMKLEIALFPHFYVSLITKFIKGNIIKCRLRLDKWQNKSRIVLEKVLEKLGSYE